MVIGEWLNQEQEQEFQPKTRRRSRSTEEFQPKARSMRVSTLNQEQELVFQKPGVHTYLAIAATEKHQQVATRFRASVK